MSDVTTLLNGIRAGQPDAADRLMKLVHAELARLAARTMAGEAAERTLSATALVNEAYLRLIDSQGALPFESRRHFFGAAAQAMRRILVDGARRRGAERHGGGRQRVELPDVADLGAERADQRLLDLDEALARLAVEHPEAAEAVELHHFAGLSHDQAAETLGLSVYEVRQRWTFAQAWLKDALK